MLPEPVEYRPSRSRTVFLFLVCLVLVFGGDLLFTDASSSTEEHWTGLVAMGFFAIGLVVFPVMLFRPRAYLRLGRETIEAVDYLGRRHFEIPLSQIAEARVVRRGRARFVALVPIDPEWGLEDAAPSARRSAKMNAAMFGSRFLVHSGTYGVGSKALASEIERHIATSRAEPGGYPRPVPPSR